jgi:hypothetical protein
MAPKQSKIHQQGIGGESLEWELSSIALTELKMLKTAGFKRSSEEADASILSSRTDLYDRSILI